MSRSHSFLSSYNGVSFIDTRADESRSEHNFQLNAPRNGTSHRYMGWSSVQFDGEGTPCPASSACKVPLQRHASVEAPRMTEVGHCSALTLVCKNVTDDRHRKTVIENRLLRTRPASAALGKSATWLGGIMGGLETSWSLAEAQAYPTNEPDGDAETAHPEAVHGMPQTISPLPHSTLREGPVSVYAGLLCGGDTQRSTPWWHPPRFLVVGLRPSSQKGRALVVELVTSIACHQWAGDTGKHMLRMSHVCFHLCSMGLFAHFHAHSRPWKESTRLCRPAERRPRTETWSFEIGALYHWRVSNPATCRVEVDLMPDARYGTGVVVRVAKTPGKVKQRKRKTDEADHPHRRRHRERLLCALLPADS
ncbi:hypothetical protein QBC34DRAFT_425727 [Podospora aff. communis PSN243]|uniref:Uncharacterized protein n=1 Tax=Podospora aff. communis PSN243 TaxID=3040156 RepID=A0AAV9GL99_9PEZI|nr:hypothetical protein QBC34DRAFT_425727 [Podospora aff. communis PSN243]